MKVKSLFSVFALSFMCALAPEVSADDRGHFRSGGAQADVDIDLTNGFIEVTFSSGGASVTVPGTPDKRAGADQYDLETTGVASVGGYSWRFSNHVMQVLVTNPVTGKDYWKNTVKLTKGNNQDDDIPEMTVWLLMPTDCPVHLWRPDITARVRYVAA